MRSPWESDPLPCGQHLFLATVVGLVPPRGLFVDGAAVVSACRILIKAVLQDRLERVSTQAQEADTQAPGREYAGAVTESTRQLSCCGVRAVTISCPWRGRRWHCRGKLFSPTFPLPIHSSGIDTVTRLSWARIGARCTHGYRMREDPAALTGESLDPCWTPLGARWGCQNTPIAPGITAPDLANIRNWVPGGKHWPDADNTVSLSSWTPVCGDYSRIEPCWSGPACV